jgi:ferric-dicitrate binding protein FerR (iron transport regulator)
MSSSNDQVYQLFMEKMAGTLSPDEEQWVKVQLENDPHFRKNWEALELQSRERGLNRFLQELDLKHELAQVHEKIDQKKAVQRSRKFPSLILRAAAMLVVIAGISYWYFTKEETLLDKTVIAAAIEEQQASTLLKLADGSLVKLDNQEENKTFQLKQGSFQTGSQTLEYNSTDTTQSSLIVPAGESFKIHLSDGTKVWLNSSTKLRFPFLFNSTKREVQLEGEAYFEVANDKDRPFIVTTSLTKVQVLGTSFNINTYKADRVSTSLVEGRVLTADKRGNQIELNPGNSAIFSSATGFSTGSFDSDEVLSWMEGRCYFHNVSIPELAAIAGRFFGVKIQLDEAKFSGKSVTGVLQKNKLADFLTDLETTSGITYYYTSGVLHLDLAAN